MKMGLGTLSLVFGMEIFGVSGLNLSGCALASQDGVRIASAVSVCDCMKQYVWASPYSSVMSSEPDSEPCGLLPVWGF